MAAQRAAPAAAGHPCATGCKQGAPSLRTQAAPVRRSRLAATSTQAHCERVWAQPRYAVQQLAAGLMACTASSLLLCGGALAEATVTENFTNKCMGCHYNGGNVVAAGATLFPDDLRRNGVADFDSIYSLVYGGKGKMPGFGTDCKPKGKCTFGPRLSDAEIRDLTQYTLDKAAAGWK